LYYIDYIIYAPVSIETSLVPFGIAWGRSDTPGIVDVALLVLVPLVVTGSTDGALTGCGAGFGMDIDIDGAGTAG